MITILLDVNVLIALAWPNHVHHGPAQVWFAEGTRGGWATCPPTQTGFVRVSSNRRVLPEARTPREAIELLRRIVAAPGHEFWSDDMAMSNPEPIDVDRIVGHRQVPDAHLLALALRRGAQIATFDRRFRDLAPDPTSVVLIPVLPEVVGPPRPGGP